MLLLAFYSLFSQRLLQLLFMLPSTSRVIIVAKLLALDKIYVDLS